MSNFLVTTWASKPLSMTIIYGISSESSNFKDNVMNYVLFLIVVNKLVEFGNNK